MPSPEVINRLQTALLWGKVGDNDYGEPIVSSPIEIMVRWVTKKRQVMGPDGTPVATDATVILGAPIAIGSIMWLGSMSEWVGTGSGDPEPYLMEVITYDETPDLKNRFTMHEASLAFFRGSLPTVSP